MGTRKTVHVPSRLAGTCRRFERWRRTRQGRSRIPEVLWTAAVKAAGRYGVHKTAQALRLDYYTLKKRVEATCSRCASVGKAASHPISDREVVSGGGQAVATFVELAPSVSGGSGECILELEDPGGAKMRVHLKGVEAPDLAALCRSFWGVEG